MLFQQDKVGLIPYLRQSLKGSTYGDPARISLAANFEQHIVGMSKLIVPHIAVTPGPVTTEDKGEKGTNVVTQFMIEPIDVLVVLNAKKDKTGIDPVDQIHFVRRDLKRFLLGWNPAIKAEEEGIDYGYNSMEMHYAGDDFSAMTREWYMHEFNFVLWSEINSEEHGVGGSQPIATQGLNKLSLTINPSSISLDEQPAAEIILNAPVTFIVDSFPPAVAYSLRNISENTIFVVRVRETIGQAEQDFTEAQILDTGPTGLLAFTGAGNGAVSIRYDQSVNGNHEIQTTASRQGLLVTNGVVNMSNGRPAIFVENFQNFDFTTPLDFTASNASFFSVYRKKTAGNKSILRFDGGNNIWLDFGPSQIIGGNTVTLTGGDHPVDTQMLISMFYDAGVSIRMYRDTVQVGETLSPSFSNLKAAQHPRFDTVGRIVLQEDIIYGDNQEPNRIPIETDQKLYYSTP